MKKMLEAYIIFPDWIIVLLKIDTGLASAPQAAAVSHLYIECIVRAVQQGDFTLHDLNLLPSF